jgi:hypothetical protein
MQRKFLAFAALPLLVLSAAPVAADSEQAPRRWLETHSSYRQGPAVYGWSYRAGPAVYGSRYRQGSAVYRWRHCGVYRYWNGNQCVDSRDNPPQY